MNLRDSSSDVAVSFDSHAPPLERSFAVQRLGKAGRYDLEDKIGALACDANEHPDVVAAAFKVLLLYWCSAPWVPALVESVRGFIGSSEDSPEGDAFGELLSVVRGVFDGPLATHAVRRALVRALAEVLDSSRGLSELQRYWAYAALQHGLGRAWSTPFSAWDRVVDPSFVRAALAST